LREREPLKFCSAANVPLLDGTIIQGTLYLAVYNNTDQAFYLHGFEGAVDKMTQRPDEHRRHQCATKAPHFGEFMNRILLAALALAFVASAAHAETCIASQYGVGDGYHGKRAAAGSISKTHALTAAMRAPVTFGTVATVTNLANGRSVRVRITDRGSFVRGRCIDLSRAAADAIGMGGLTRVSVE
jgi:rare lipoprotein A